MKSPWLWGILLLAISLRVALLAAAWNDQKIVMTPDSHDYTALADRLVTHGDFGPGNVFRTPGYPAFIGLPMLESFRIVLIIQIAIDVALVLLTYIIGRQLVSQRVGLVGAFLQAMSPLAIGSSCRMLSDSLYAFMLAVAMLLLMRHFRLLRGDIDAAAQILQPQEPRARVRLSGRTVISLVLAAFVLGAAAYVRPIALMMAVPIGLVVLVGKRGLTRATIFASVFVVCLAPWVTRNVVTKGYWGFSTFASNSFVKYTAYPAVVEARSIEHPLEKDLWIVEFVAPDFDDQKMDEAFKEEVTREALKHPFLIAKCHLKGAPVFWWPATDVLEMTGLTQPNRGTLSVLFREGWLRAIGNYLGPDPLPGTIAVVAMMLAFYLVWLVGIILCVAMNLPRIIRSRLKMPPEVWIILLLVVLSMLAPGLANHPRFRVPLEPYLCVASAAGWLMLGKAIFGRRSKNSTDAPGFACQKEGELRHGKQDAPDAPQSEST